MEIADGQPVHTQRLWGDFRMFLAGHEPTDDRVAAFAASVENTLGCNTYGLPVVGCARVIVDELRKRIAA